MPKYPALCSKRTKFCESFSRLIRYSAAMQDRTINNALLALRRQGGEAQELAERLLAMRGVALPKHTHDRPLSRGQCRRLALSMLPCTSSVIADAIQERLPGVSRKSAGQRAYMALRRLEAIGEAKRSGREWIATAGPYKLWAITAR